MTVEDTDDMPRPGAGTARLSGPTPATMPTPAMSNPPVGGAMRSPDMTAARTPMATPPVPDMTPAASGEGERMPAPVGPAAPSAGATMPTPAEPRVVTAMPVPPTSQ